MKILLVEDDKNLADLLASALTAEHYAVDVAVDGLLGWELASAFTYDLILLDIMLPRLDGISLCRKLRSQGSQTPILLLTAQGTSTSKVLGLDAGADDYMTKPFDLQELLARIRALQRRESTVLQPVLHWETLALDPSTREVTHRSEPIHLRPREYDLLELLLRNPHRVFSRNTIIDHLWSFEGSPGEETVTAHIKGLRQHLKAAGVRHDPIETVYGIGYRLRAETPEKNGLTPQAAHQANDKTSAIWERTKQRLNQRMAVLEEATTLGITDALPDDLRQQAEQEAHKLAGSLGMFNFDTGSQLARAVEDAFQHWPALKSDQRQQLAELVQTLRQSLQQATQIQTPNLFYPETSRSQLEVASSDFTHQKTGDSVKPKLVTPSGTTTILVVDDDPNILEAVAALLEPWGLKICTLNDPQQFWNTLQQTQPDLLMLDVEMPYQDGLKLCQTLRQEPLWEHLPVLFLTAHTDPDTQRRVFAVGADDYVSKPVVGPELITRIFNRLERIHLVRLHQQVDALTGVTNRPHATQAIEQYLASPATHSLCLATLRLDRLTQINRQYGYQAGDTVLARLGQLLQQTFTEDEVVGRWGGRLFVVAMPGTSRQAGVRRLKEVLANFRQMSIEINHQQKVAPLTFSAGVVTYPQSGRDWPTLLETALAALGRTRPGYIVST